METSKHIFNIKKVGPNSLLKIIWLLFLSIGIHVSSYSQCANNNVYYTSISSLNPNSSHVFNCAYGGEYVTIPVVSGAQYTISTCGGGNWDSQLTLYNNSGGPALAYNDDYCGLQSNINWTATFTGILRIALDKYYCTDLNNCMNITVTRNQNNPPALNPCHNNNLSVISCNNSYPFILSGSGQWNSLGGPYTTPGEEKVYEFTATSTGNYTISISNNNYYVDLYYKTNNCGPTGWTYIDDIYSFGTNNIYLTAGTTYYFLVDDENTTTSNGNFSISCPIPCNPPTNGIDYTYSAPFNHSSTTSNSCNDCSYRPSNDRTYQVTITCPGTYTFATCGGATWDTYLYLTTSACGGNILASNDDACSLQSQLVTTLNPGSYYLTIEGFSSTSEGPYTLNVLGGGSNVTGNPIISGPNTLCQNSTASFNVSGVTGASSYNWAVANGTILSGQGTSNIQISTGLANAIISVTPNSACGDGASASFNIIVQSAPNVSAITTDVNCFGNNNGSVAFSPASANYLYSIDGVNYFSSNIFSNLSPGIYNLKAQVLNLPGCTSTATSITITQPAQLNSSIATSNYNGYNISCNGGNNGSATVNVNGGVNPYSYNWSNNSTSSSASNLSAQAYNVIVTDANGCNSSANITITEPSALTMIMSPNQVVYVGYGPYSCAAINTSIGGGVGPYNYSWSNSANQQSVSVCPSVTTIYTVIATDANGCTITGTVKVCAINVVCYAGNSTVAKVSVCHVPPGNPQNPQQICVSVNAVAAQLMLGSYLGTCNSSTACNSSSARGINETETPEALNQILDFNIYPNPANSVLTFEYFILQKGKTRIEIKDVTGRTVLTTPELDGDANTSKINSISVSEFPSGIYFMVIKQNSQVLVKKFVVEK